MTRRRNPSHFARECWFNDYPCADMRIVHCRTYFRYIPDDFVSQHEREGSEG